jgi:hypothetical protein
MPPIVCQTGQEATISSAIDYLARRYRMPPEDIRGVRIDAEVGEPIRLTVTLFQQSEDDVTEREISVLDHPERVFLRSDGTWRTEPWHTPDETLNHPGSDRWTGGDRKDEDVPVDVYAVPNPLDPSKWDDGAVR